MKNLYAKLFLIQQEIPAIEKDSTNPHFKNDYYDINSLLAVLKPIMHKHKVLLLQPVKKSAEGNEIVTILTDIDSGETMEFATALPEVSDPQKFGSVVTYFRRYVLTPLLALQAADDDGETAKTAVMPKAAAPAAMTVTPTKSVGTPKICIKCFKEHTGLYTKCINCWKEENPS